MLKSVWLAAYRLVVAETMCFGHLTCKRLKTQPAIYATFYSYAVLLKWPVHIVLVLVYLCERMSH